MTRKQVSRSEKPNLPKILPPHRSAVAELRPDYVACTICCGARRIAVQSLMQFYLSQGNHGSDPESVPRLLYLIRKRTPLRSRSVPIFFCAVSEAESPAITADFPAFSANALF